MVKIMGNYKNGRIIFIGIIICLSCVLNFNSFSFAEPVESPKNYPEGKNVSSGNADIKPENIIRYRITKRFQLKASVDLVTLQFKFPLYRKDIVNQRVAELEASPKFNALINDPDGNRIAIFYFSNVRGGEAINIEISYKAEVDWQDININPSKVTDDYPQDTPDLARYLKREENIDISDDLIQNTAKDIVEDIKNPYLKGKAIYDFIVANIKYENTEDFSGLQRCKETLIQKRGNCADITKLYIALARASGIPTRQVCGLVFTPNVSPTKSIEKIGHAWVEIYLPVYGWVPVDPTFGISQKEEYYCFYYKTHIREFYGQVISRNPGSLYSGSSIEVRSYNQISGVPVNKDAQIEIELLSFKK